MLPHHTKLTKYLFALFVIVVLVYAFFGARNLLFGPRISIDAPGEIVTVTESLVEIQGSIENVTVLTLSGRDVLVDDTGVFSETLLLAPGSNTFVFEARDRFGRTTRKTLEILFVGENPPPATSDTVAPEDSATSSLPLQ